ncbi:unnamed protein product [Darwinula stevensoni]|uniref:Glutamine amidotransferase type-2 domain-containing protein n=1 Tax=Darwinula stevensoni TaxID=69355 RepID=A0A7R9A702_9CRUS|nr:unnamed protein product [Darwinula stevensoni]CAG0889588.1 unnamed protein product [Darwinula stevensoni]
MEEILRDAETLSVRMKHRGACSCDNDTGDGAGVVTAIPHQLYFNAHFFCQSHFIVRTQNFD